MATTLTQIVENTSNLEPNNDTLNNIATSKATAFGEQKVAIYQAETAWKFPDNINSRLITSTVANGGTVTHNGSFAVLSTSAANNGSARIQTKKVIRYAPGIGGNVKFTAIFDTPQVGSTQIIGIGNDVDGLFIGYNGTDFGILRRSNSVDNWTIIDQPFDGFNPQLGNVYQILFQWLGFGEIRYYVEIPSLGSFSIASKIQYANTTTDVSLRNPTLPLMAEVKNNGNTFDIILKTPSATAGLDGNPDNQALVTIDGLSVLDTAYTTPGVEVPILTLRNNVDYAGGAGNNRTPLRIDTISLAASNTNVRSVVFKLVLNGNLTGASYSDISANTTPGQEDTTATAISGGSLNFPFTVIANTSSKEVDLIGKKIDLAPGDTLTVTAMASVNISQLSVGISYANLF